MSKLSETDRAFLTDSFNRGQEMTRRQLLQKAGRAGLVIAGVGAFPGLLAACGQSDSSATSTPSATSTGLPKAGGNLDFIYWEGYDFPEVMKAWEKDNAVTMRATYMGSVEDIPAKLKGGASGYDLICYGTSYKPFFSQLGFLTPIDESKIPNIGNLLPFFASDNGNFWVDSDGTRTGVPMTWGAMGLSYDEAVIKEAPTSYDILFDRKYKGKVAITDDALGAYGQAAQVLGFSSARMTESDFKSATSWLTDLVKQTSGVSPSYGDVSTRLISGDAHLSFLGWAAFGVFAKQAGKDTIKTIWPEQGGGLGFADAWAIPPSADNSDTAYAWINETLKPAVMAKMSDSLVAGATVTGAEQLMKPDIGSLYPYDDLDAFFEKAPLQEDPPVKSDEYVTRDKVLAAWQEVKASV